MMLAVPWEVSTVILGCHSTALSILVVCLMVGNAVHVLVKLVVEIRAVGSDYLPCVLIVWVYASAATVSTDDVTCEG